MRKTCENCAHADRCCGPVPRCHGCDCFDRTLPKGQGPCGRCTALPDCSSTQNGCYFTVNGIQGVLMMARVWYDEPDVYDIDDIVDELVEEAIAKDLQCDGDCLNCGCLTECVEGII